MFVHKRSIYALTLQAEHAQLLHVCVPSHANMNVCTYFSYQWHKMLSSTLLFTWPNIVKYYIIRSDAVTIM